MANLIPMEQAAAMLGISIDKLTELRSNNEIFGYRDGQNWKFKMTELERVAGELGVDLKAAGDVLGSVDDELDFELSDSSTEISSADLSADVSPSSDSESMDLMGESNEFNFDESGELRLEESGELQLEGGSDVFASDEPVTDEEELSFGSSSISLAASSSKKLVSSDTDKMLEGGSSDLLDDEAARGESPSDTGKLLAGDSNLSIAEDDDLFSDELELADSGSFEESAELSSDFEDSDLVLDDSDSSNEILLDAGDSGISLSANDSGIELDDEPLELGGSDIDSLELPEDDDDLIELDEVAEPDAATMMQEDEFKLTALEEDLDDQSSGSQVIALEDSEIYTDESEATILADSDDLASQPAMLPASDSYGADQGSVFDQAGVMAPDAGAAAAGGAMMMPGGAAVQGAPVSEVPFSGAHVLGLGALALLLATAGVLGLDLCRNLWMSQDQVISSGLLDFFLNIFFKSS